MAEFQKNRIFAKTLNNMKKAIILFAFSVLFITVKANDGAFFSRGNQLIPIVETDIRVQKEILKIDRINDKYGTTYDVSVYYEFFNPSAAKDLLVGFEAAPPYPINDLSYYPNHPGISNFKAVMNGTNLSYEVAHVPYQTDKNGYLIDKMGGYYKNGRFQNLTRQQCEEISYNKEYDYYYDDARFYYVYHFKAHFNPGLNTIQHTYRFDGSAYVMTEYLFDYVLTAANRWANNGIDDFTLEINMGDRESFAIAPTFFKSAKEWTIQGKGRFSTQKNYAYDFSEESVGRPMFHIQEGKVVFHKKNFHPDGELSISKPNYYYGDDEVDPFTTQYFSLSSFFFDMFIGTPLSADKKRILRNMPFAYRGYVFKTPELQRYFESTNWYIPNPDYKSNIDELNPNEKAWIQTVTK